jgi:hypothetical protein
MKYQVERKPDDFDWVTARAKCSSVELFEKLKMLVENDIEIRNTFRKKDSPYFKIVKANPSRFSVVAEAIGIHLTVAFSLSNNVISVAGINGPIFDAIATFCNDGECRAKIGDQEYDLWQLRKMALEDLFFRNYSEN